MIDVYTVIVLMAFGILFGWITFPFVLFLRARRDAAWDNSNMTNIFRVVAHVGTHPGDLAMVYYLTDEQLGLLENGGESPKKIFPYLGKDELSDVVDTRPPQ